MPLVVGIREPHDRADPDVDVAIAQPVRDGDRNVRRAARRVVSEGGLDGKPEQDAKKRDTSTGHIASRHAVVKRFHWLALVECDVSVARQTPFR